MPSPSLSADARDFIMKMQPKHARQVLLKLLDLCANPHPPDSAQLRGDTAYRRIDVGEYRVIYKVQGEVVKIHTIGNRNDDEVYKAFQRKQK